MLELLVPGAVATVVEEPVWICEDADTERVVKDGTTDIVGTDK